MYSLGNSPTSGKYETLNIRPVHKCHLDTGKIIRHRVSYFIVNELVFLMNISRNVCSCKNNKFHIPFIMRI